MGVAAVNPALIKTGPGIIRWAALGSTIPTVTATTSKVTATWGAPWLAAGSTDAGLTYTESSETAEIRVAESLYAVDTKVTGKTSRIAFALNEISDVNWKFAMNGGTITVSGTGPTKLSEYAPPLAGNEVDVMLSFESYDGTEVIVWPQTFNVGSVETARGTVETKGLLPFEMAAKLPQNLAGWTIPYKRWVAGALAVSS